MAKHKALAGAMPFHHKKDVMHGTKQTHLKPKKIKRAKSTEFVNSMVHTDLVKGPGKAKAKHSTSKARTYTKA